MTRAHTFTSRHVILIPLALALLMSGCSSSEEADPGPPVPTPLPLVINDLTAIAGTATSVTLGWTSPGLSDKTTIRYDVRYIAYGSEESDWDTWTVAPAPESDTSSGLNKTHTVMNLTSSQVFVFRMAASTDGVEWSIPSNFVVATAVDLNVDVNWWEENGQ